MPRVCKICQDISRVEIDKMLVQGRSKTEIAQKFNVPYASVDYHERNHLSHQLRSAYEKKAALEGLDLLSEIEELVRRTKRIMDTAEADGKLNTALNAIGQARGSYDLLARIAFSLHQARSQELELERMKSEEAQREGATNLATRICDNLTKPEIDLLYLLMAKANGESKEIIVPGGMLPRFSEDPPPCHLLQIPLEDDEVEENPYRDMDQDENSQDHGSDNGRNGDHLNRSIKMERTKLPQAQSVKPIEPQEIPVAGAFKGRHDVSIARRKLERKLRY